MTTKTDITLLPCPFCGGPAYFSRSDELVNVRCKGWNPGECLGAGPNCHTEVEAAAGWNRRAAVEADRQGRMPSDEEIEACGAGGPMSLVVALDFADNPRPYGSLASPADTNGELYKALRALAAEYRALLSRYSSSQPAASAEQIGTRHPTVVKWRNNGIEACAGIADAYGMDQAAADMRAMLAREENDEPSTPVAKCPSDNSPCDGGGVDSCMRSGGVSGVAPVAQAPVADAASTLAAICDLFGIGSAARDPGTILTNVENVVRRSECLRAVERHLTVSTPPDPDEGDDELGEECLLRWGADHEGYAKHFLSALKKFGYTLVTPTVAPIAAQAQPDDDDLPSFVIYTRPGMVPERKGPYPTAALVEAALRELQAAHPDATSMVIPLPADSYPQSGAEWIDMYGDWSKGRLMPAQQPASGADQVQPSAQAARDVLAERQRQISAEGWTPEHDDEHGTGQMAAAAGCYALRSGGYEVAGPHAPKYWPWDASWWKPTNKRRNLVKAGALVIAEIERIDRATARAAKGADHA